VEIRGGPKRRRHGSRRRRRCRYESFTCRRPVMAIRAHILHMFNGVRTHRERERESALEERRRAKQRQTTCCTTREDAFTQSQKRIKKLNDWIFFFLLLLLLLFFILFVYLFIYLYGFVCGVVLSSSSGVSINLTGRENRDRKAPVSFLDVHDSSLLCVKSPPFSHKLFL
jgi:ABC-type multidrug transport system fused ATPase/permease subunit